MKQVVDSTKAGRVACSHRRGFLFLGLGLGAAWSGALAAADAGTPQSEGRWMRMAEDMKRQAESWGDQGYGAVLVLDGQAIGFGPSRVVIDRDPDSHAERVALRDAQGRIGRAAFPGAVLYSTSRPCALCEAAAAAAQVARMVHGPSLHDAGVPRAR
jgi:tRNA(Arg) A34 adenosine deaminase TadA